MKWFKFNWFTSKDRETLKKNTEGIERVEKTVAAVLEAVTKNPAPKVDLPYKNIIFSNGNITVVFHDSTILDKMGVDREFFDKIKNAYSVDVIKGLMIDATPAPIQISEVQETKEELQLIADNLAALRGHKDFIIDGDVVMLKGVSLQIPAIILASFIEILEKSDFVAEQIRESVDNEDLLAIDEEDLFCQYLALKMFWLKLALNPLEQSRKDLLTFCRKNDVRITNNGNIILYRRIVSKAGADINYVKFISQTYYSLKKKGEDTRNYAIGQKPNTKGAFYFVDLREEKYIVEELIGNLQHMYMELPDYENNNFTAHWDRSVKIKIGGIYSIPEDKINLNNSICAAGGLHAAAVDYNYSGFGDTPVVVLVNPSKAITVPLGETGKLRTTEMFIACVNSQPLGVHFDESALSAFDEEYHDLTLTELEEAAQQKSFIRLAIQNNAPIVSLVELKNITQMLKSRIKNIV